MKKSEIEKAKSRIIILCEGKTEKIAITTFIARRWEKDGLKSIGLHPINLEGKIKDISKRLKHYANDEKVIAVFTLIDLQGTENFDGIKYKSTDNLPIKVNKLKNWLKKLVDKKFKKQLQNKYFPHIAVHQIESWILAEGKTLGEYLKISLEPDPKAEEKNFQNPPVKRINKLFKKSHFRREYKKIIDGKSLFKKMDFDTVNECSYFESFYNALQKVAKQYIK